MRDKPTAREIAKPFRIERFFANGLARPAIPVGGVALVAFLAMEVGNKGSVSMLTDAPPRKNRSGFLENDRIKTLDLPRNRALTEIAQRLEAAVKSENIRDVRSACTKFLATASNFYANRKLASGLWFLKLFTLRSTPAMRIESRSNGHSRELLLCPLNPSYFLAPQPGNTIV